MDVDIEKMKVSQVIWTELWMDGGVTVCNIRLWRRRKLKKEIKKPRYSSGEVELAVRYVENKVEGISSLISNYVTKL